MAKCERGGSVVFVHAREDVKTLCIFRLYTYPYETNMIDTYIHNFELLGNSVTLIKLSEEDYKRWAENQAGSQPEEIIKKKEVECKYVIRTAIMLQSEQLRCRIYTRLVSLQSAGKRHHALFVTARIDYNGGLLCARCFRSAGNTENLSRVCVRRRAVGVSKIGASLANGGAITEMLGSVIHGQRIKV